MKKLPLAFACLLALFNYSCINQKKEIVDFADRISSMFNGAKTSVAIDNIDKQDGTDLIFRLKIEGVPADSNNGSTIDRTSLPAYLFYKDHISKMEEYDFVEITINPREGGKPKKYAMAGLEVVDECTIVMNGFISAIKQANRDSIGFYLDPAATHFDTLDSLSADLRRIENKNGPVSEAIFEGFRIVEAGSHSMIIFNCLLKRKNENESIEISVRPSTKKVYAYKL